MIQDSFNLSLIVKNRKMQTMQNRQEQMQTHMQGNTRKMQRECKANCVEFCIKYQGNKPYLSNFV